MEFLLEEENVLERMVVMLAQQYEHIVLNAIGLIHVKRLTMTHSLDLYFTTLRVTFKT